jgi:hypothetical protein
VSRAVWLAALIACAACARRTPAAPVVVDQAGQLVAADGRDIRLVGQYAPVATATKMSRPGQPSPEVELGYVVIVLAGEAAAYDPAAAPGDVARIELGTGPRTGEEIARLRDRRVSVEGRLVLAPASPEGAATTRPAPVLLEPRELRVSAE